MAEEKGEARGSDPGKEIERYSQILSRDPQSRAFAPLAEAYRKAGMLDDALEIARTGLKHHPGYLSGSVALGRALFEKGEYGSAKEEFLRVVSAAPDNLMAHKLLGQIHLCLKDGTAAEKSFRMVLLLDPRDKEAQEYLEKAAAPPPPSPADAFPPPIEETAAEPAGEPPFEVVPEAPPAAGGEAGTPAAPEAADHPEDLDFGKVEEDWLTGEEAPPAEGSDTGPDVWDGTVGRELSGESVFELDDLEGDAPLPEAGGESGPEEAEGTLEVYSREDRTEAPAAFAGEGPAAGGSGEAGDGERTLEVADFVDEADDVEILDLETDVDMETESLPPPAEVLPPPADEASAPVTEEAPAAGPLPEEFPGEPLPDLSGEDAPMELSLEEATELGEELLLQDDDTDGEEETPPAPGTEDIFGTETLADLYISQGFYGKAAEVYRGLLRERPDESGLRQKLEEVLALEKMEASGTGGQQAPGESGETPSPPGSDAPEAPGRGKDTETVIDELRQLMSRLKERP